MAGELAGVFDTAIAAAIAITATAGSICCYLLHRFVPLDLQILLHFSKSTLVHGYAGFSKTHDSLASDPDEVANDTTLQKLL